MSKRQKAISQKNGSHKLLLTAIRNLQDLLVEIYEASIERDSKFARALKPLKSRGVLQGGEIVWLTRALNEMNLHPRYNKKCLYFPKIVAARR